jgi:hypothetical protein
MRRKIWKAYYHLCSKRYQPHFFVALTTFLPQVLLATNCNTHSQWRDIGYCFKQIVLPEYVIWLHNKLCSPYYCVLLTVNFKLSVLNPYTSSVGHALPMAGQQIGLKPTSF